MDSGNILRNKMKNFPGQSGVRGFTLIELLISMAIVGLLLTALAIALNASVINYQENQKILLNS